MKNDRFTLVLIILLWGNICFSQNQKDTLNVLFVGNSYTYYSNMPHLVSLISDNTQTKLVTSKSVVGGARLSEHWRGERGLKTLELIKNGHFDIVVLQDHSMSAIDYPDSLLLYVKKFAEFIKENNAQPYLYCTWARNKVPQYQETITSVYDQAAQENNMELVPVGDTWALAKCIRPQIDLFTSDGSHPSPLGAFLTACTFVKELSNELPEKLPSEYRVIDANGEWLRISSLDPLDITYCLKVVNEMIK